MITVSLEIKEVWSYWDKG